MEFLLKYILYIFKVKYMLSFLKHVEFYVCLHEITLVV